MRYNNSNFAKAGLNQKLKFSRLKTAAIERHAEQIGATKAYHRHGNHWVEPFLFHNFKAF